MGNIPLSGTCVPAGTWWHSPQNKEIFVSLNNQVGDKALYGRTFSCEVSAASRGAGRTILLCASPLFGGSLSPNEPTHSGRITGAQGQGLAPPERWNTAPLKHPILEGSGARLDGAHEGPLNMFMQPLYKYSELLTSMQIGCRHSNLHVFVVRTSRLRLLIHARARFVHAFCLWLSFHCNWIFL